MYGITLSDLVKNSHSFKSSPAFHNILNTLAKDGWLLRRLYSCPAWLGLD